MPKHTAVKQRANVGLAPPDSPIPGAITYEQAPAFATGAGWWLWNPLNRQARVAVVMACVRLICHQCSVLPAYVRREGLRVPDQPGWLTNPAPTVYGYLGDAVESALVSLLMRGNAYLIATGFGSNGYPLGWVVANPDTVSIERDYETGRLLYRWGTNLLTESDVAHIKWLEVPGSPYGASPLEGAWANLLAADAMAAYSSELAISGAMPFGLLTTEQRLQKGQAMQLRDQFTETGSSRKGLLVLDSGLSYTQLSLSPKDMMLLEAQEWNARALCSVFGVPPSLVNIPNSDGLTYSTVKMQTESLLSFCLDPVLTKFEGVVSYRFLPGDRMLHFNRDRFTLPSYTERMTAHSTAIAAGIYTAAEARAMEGLPPAPFEEISEVTNA